MSVFRKNLYGRPERGLGRPACPPVARWGTGHFNKDRCQDLVSRGSVRLRRGSGARKQRDGRDLFDRAKPAHRRVGHKGVHAGLAVRSVAQHRLPDRGQNRRRVARIAADVTPLFGAVKCYGFRVVAHGRLGRSIGRRSRNAHAAKAGRDIDDRARAPWRRSRSDSRGMRRQESPPQGRKTAQGHHRECVVQAPSEMGGPDGLTDTVAKGIALSSMFFPKAVGSCLLARPLVIYDQPHTPS